MKSLNVSTGLKIILIIFAHLILFQTLSFGMDLMNKPDSYVVNLGVAIFTVNIALILYLLKKLLDNAIKFINEEKQKENSNNN
jgi:hypothetical protein